MTLDENNFLRSYSDDTYLWYDKIVDQDPGLFNDPLVYFDQLQTTAITPSGQPKDKFHFTFDSEEWFQLSQSGAAGRFWRRIYSPVRHTASRGCGCLHRTKLACNHPAGKSGAGRNPACD